MRGRQRDCRPREQPRQSALLWLFAFFGRIFKYALTHGVVDDALFSCGISSGVSEKFPETPSRRLFRHFSVGKPRFSAAKPSVSLLELTKNPLVLSPLPFSDTPWLSPERNLVWNAIVAEAVFCEKAVQPSCLFLAAVCRVCSNWDAILDRRFMRAALIESGGRENVGAFCSDASRHLSDKAHERKKMPQHRAAGARVDVHGGGVC